MAKLYAEESIVLAVEAGKKAAEYALARNFDVHFRDAVMKCGLEANAVASPHVDEDQIPKSSLPPDDDQAAKQVLQLCEDCERQIPKGGNVTPASLDPALLMMILQIASQLMELFRRRKEATP